MGRTDPLEHKHRQWSRAAPRSPATFPEGHRDGVAAGECHTAGFQELAEFDNIGDYRTPDDRDYLHLRENDENVGSFQSVTPTITWSQYMAEIGNAQKGDLVFYSDRSRISTGAMGESITWTHVAMITDWGLQTEHAWPITGTYREPLVVDHDGPSVIAASYLPRSLGDTDGSKIEKVIVLHAP
jgi:hypothetical protein